MVFEMAFVPVMWSGNCTVLVSRLSGDHKCAALVLSVHSSI